MTANWSDLDPEIYVLASHFINSDDAALFGALVATGKMVELVIIEDPDNPLLHRHAELQAESMMGALSTIERLYPYSKLAEINRNILNDVDTRGKIVEKELTNLRAVMSSPDMGVFAVYGARTDVEAFVEAHRNQP